MLVDTPAKMRHQIMVRYGDEVQVFEGYMIREGNAFLVRAFAGPGVDLFTVARDGKRHREEAHISALEERLDLEAVSMDIARAYLGGCEKPEGTKAECTLLGEPMIEEFDEVDFGTLPEFEVVKKYFGAYITHMKGTEQGIYFEGIMVKAMPGR